MNTPDKWYDSIGLLRLFRVRWEAFWFFFSHLYIIEKWRRREKRPIGSLIKL